MQKKYSFEDEQTSKIHTPPKVVRKFTLVTDSRKFEILTPDASFIKSLNSRDWEVFFKGFEIFEEDIKTKSLFDEEEQRPSDSPMNEVKDLTNAI